MTQPRWREWPPDIQSVLFLTVPVIPEWSFCFPTATTRFIWSVRTRRGTARYQLNSDLANAIASKPCNLSGGTVEFIIDISNLQIKRFALHVTCSGSIWAEFMLLIISYSDLSVSLEEAGITKVKLYSTYDSKMIFKACTVQGSNGKIRIQAQNNYGEACMVSIISPYK